MHFNVIMQAVKMSKAQEGAVKEIISEFGLSEDTLDINGWKDEVVQSAKGDLIDRHSKLSVLYI